jgi:site-specific recombinase XerD
MEEDSMKKYRGVFEKDRGSGVWWIQYFDSDGKRHREKIGTKGAAIKLVELRRTQRLEGRKLPKPRTRPLAFRELTAAVMAYTAGKAGHRNNVCQMKKVVAEFGDCVAEEITPEQIEAWLNSAAQWTVATRNRYIALLKLTFRLAEKAKRIKFNPARLVRQQKENNARIRWLSDSEEIALRAVIQLDYPDHMPELEIGLHTGMRRSEQYGMEWQFVDFKNRLITIPKAKHGDVRYVRMNSRVAVLLCALKDKSVGSGRVFALQSPRYWFEPAVKAAGLKDFTWHCLRHTFISRLVMAGVDLRTVQELAGHKSIAMTCRYAHLTPGHHQAAVEMLVAPSAPTTATGEIEGPDKYRTVVQ